MTLFLIQSKESAAGPCYYFADRVPDVVSSFVSEEFSEITSEVANQKAIFKDFSRIAVGKPTAADAKIQKTLGELTRTSTQVSAWERLLKLPYRDLPALVRN